MASLFLLYRMDRSISAPLTIVIIVCYLIITYGTEFVKTQSQKFFISYPPRFSRRKISASTRSPYFIPSRKRARPPSPIGAIAHSGSRREAPPNALANSRPQGRAHSAMSANLRNGISVRPARMHSTSSGKKGNRKASSRKISVSLESRPGSGLTAFG